MANYGLLPRVFRLSSRTVLHCHPELPSTVISNRPPLSSRTVLHCHPEPPSTVISNACERSRDPSSLRSVGMTIGKGLCGMTIGKGLCGMTVGKGRCRNNTWAMALWNNNKKPLCHDNRAALTEILPLRPDQPAFERLIAYPDSKSLRRVQQYTKRQSRITQLIRLCS